MNNVLIDTPDAMRAALPATRAEQEHVFCPECAYFTPHQMRAADGSNTPVCLPCLTLLVICEAADILPRYSMKRMLA
jgi:hypothetical protein